MTGQGNILETRLAELTQEIQEQDEWKLLRKGFIKKEDLNGQTHHN